MTDDAHRTPPPSVLDLRCLLGDSRLTSTPTFDIYRPLTKGSERNYAPRFAFGRKLFS